MRPSHLLLFLLPFVIAACGRPAVSPPSSEAPVTETPPAAAPEKQPAAQSVPAVAEDAPSEAVPYHNPLTPAEQAAGWISLFDGHTLFGWNSNREEINWHVAEGAIVADSGPVGLLVTSVPFADYELLCEYRMEAGGNSGVFLRTLADPKEVDKDCYEVNIADEHPAGFLTGSLVGRKATESPIRGSGDWQTLRMTFQGNRLQVQHHGDDVLDYVDETEHARPSGLIGLQKNAGRIEFRKVILKPLGLDRLFNGEDLTGWRVVPGSKSAFSVEDGVIRVVNGAGFLETEGTYQDFIFQSEARTHAPELNSGYFFRAMKGTEEAPSNGYESQIHNGFLDGDRTKPKDAGTGAIFRRVNARRVVPNDGEWFTTTLIAHGPRIAVWVNGYLVVDWEDTREPDENPRRGLRLEGGHISLQGHDPTTDLSFRNLRIAEYSN